MAAQPGTSKATPGDNIYPYLLRKHSIVRANQVWALDSKYERIYLRAYDSVADARADIAE